MRTVNIEVFNFNELSESAQKKAISKYQDINVSYDWWDTIYENAINIHLKITESDASVPYCKIQFLSAYGIVANNIIKEHGENSDSYKAADKYLKEILDTSEEDEENIAKAYDRFEKALINYYSTMLQKEFEYLQSNEAVIEAINANEYEFTQDGLTWTK